MLRGKSWVRRAGVVLVVLFSLCASTFSLPHADGADDPECNPIPVAHNEGAHYVGGADPARTPDHADHCFLCHSLRSFHSAFDRFQHQDTAPRIEHIYAAQVGRPQLVEWTLVPGRAPPA